MFDMQENGQRVDLTIKDAYVFDKCFAPNPPSERWIPVENEFVYFSSRPEADAKTAYNYLSQKYAEFGAEKPLDFGFLHSLGIFSNAALKAADEWVGNSASVGITKDFHPTLQFYRPITRARSFFSRLASPPPKIYRPQWYLDGLLTAVYLGSLAYPDGIGSTLEWIPGSYRFSTGLANILKLDPQLAEARDDIALKEASRLGWTTARIESTYRTLKDSGLSEKTIMAGISHKVRDALMVMVKRRLGGINL